MTKCICDGKSYPLAEKSVDIYGTGTAFNYLDAEFKAPYLYVSAELYSDESMYAQIKLNYCPKCGRYLGGGKYESN